VGKAYVLLRGGDEHKIVQPGRYELEYSGNPTDGGTGRWLRIKGTELGVSEKFLREESEESGSGIRLEKVGDGSGVE
jgi:hypothetical protein